jgi:hypothetical protein
MAITGSAKQLKGALRKIHYGGSAVCHRFKVCMIAPLLTAAFSNRDAGGLIRAKVLRSLVVSFLAGLFKQRRRPVLTRPPPQ